MKKFLILASLFALLSAPAYANTGSGKVEQMFSATALNGTGSTIVSRTFATASLQSMGYWLKPNKAATPEGSAVDLRIQGSYDTTSANFATMSTVFLGYGATTTGAAIATAGTIAVVPCMKYVRFLAQGATGNATGTTVTAYVYTQE